ncbi:hypothetical protein [Nonomuraea wenchangensis]|uniref:Uncharacterized protein n=1 Tax=Nonomuraea wenchangensis TaxID=568860 RepID=A0A1I0LTC2_9ACTN|nr:hypothetical protein [Nonomuraea wenchangensis]SEU46331.1 hypothetical protein SAMN05421811_1273 [Nonomuraea wenchangensis]
MPHGTLGSSAAQLLIHVVSHQDDTEGHPALADSVGRRDLRLIDHGNQHTFVIEGDPGELADFVASLAVAVAQELDGVVDVAGRVHASLVVNELLPTGGPAQAAETSTFATQPEGTR